jgi:hypothetical protein
MRLSRYSGHLVLTGIGLMAMAGLELITGQPAIALQLAVSFGVGSAVLIIAGFLFSDMDKLKRKTKGEGDTDKDLRG